MSQRFVANIQKLDFYPANRNNRSLLFSSELHSAKNPTELAALEDAFRLRADAVYFRHFRDGRPAIPQIYLYDNVDESLSSVDLAAIHRDLWSSCRVPIFIEMRASEFAVFDARKPVTVDQDLQISSSPISGTIQLISDAVRQYSRIRFDSGQFWESEVARGHFKDSTSAYRDLITNLKTIRENFIATESLPRKVANKLLVYSILVKYLEERGNQGDRLFASDFFAGFGAENFCDVLQQNGRVVELFDELGAHFNGKIFSWTDESERRALAESDLSSLAQFLYGDIELKTGQGSFWRRYSFNHLPVELISTVYEELLNERRDAVYTPEFLVNTLVDQALPPVDKDRTHVKTIDVSCGSGIFLVSVFKRLVQRRRFQKFKQTQRLSTLNSNQLLKIVRENIFGIDIEEDAIRLTVFSLCLALCDQLTPKEIWTELRFDDTFQRNFKAQNFFEFIGTNRRMLGSFDLVIGNPPFAELRLLKDRFPFQYSDNGKTVDLNAQVTHKLNRERNQFPRNQLALMFLDQSPELLKDDGLLCLIMPAAPLLYNASIEFRKNFFGTRSVRQILDLTALEPCLFETARVPTAAIFADKGAPKKTNTVAHITVRRTRSAEEKQFLEIDKYDYHALSQQDAITLPFVWKCNLLGGGRLAEVVDRFSKLETIGDFVKKNGWYSSEGYIVGDNPRNRTKRATFVTGKRSLPAEAIGENEVDMSQAFEEESRFFTRPRKEQLFTPPVLLIREVAGRDRIPTHLSEEYLTFKHQILGVSSPKKDLHALEKLAAAFDRNRAIYKVLLAVKSGRYLVGKATSLLAKDILGLPFVPDSDALVLSKVEEIIFSDVIEYHIEALARGSLAEANARAANREDLKTYGEVFAMLLNSVYGRSGKFFFPSRVSTWDDFFVYQFEYKAEQSPIAFDSIVEDSDSLQSLLTAKSGQSAHLIKTLKIYRKNEVYFLKPRTLRYWLPSVAVIDADEVFADSIVAGY